jgi:hypothetical protein
MEKVKPKARRIVELDLLRGYFIFVIIINHVQRWPSPLTWVTGEGRLWVSAAEGFFIISGLLVGYIRGYKQRHVPMREITKLLLSRALILYLWSIIITFVAMLVYVYAPIDPAIIPIPPSADLSGPQFVWQVITQQYVFDWIYFLRLYWMMLAATPIFIWLLRKKLDWLATAISIALYAGSFLMQTPEAALQWQVLFFIPAIIGYRLDAIINWLRQPKVKKTAIISAITLTAITALISGFWVLGWGFVGNPNSLVSMQTYTTTRTWLDPWFYKSPLAIGRVVLAFVWFAGFLALFHVARPLIQKYLGWLFFEFGNRSLTAYIIHGPVLLMVQLLVPLTWNPLLNLIISVGTVMIVWALLKVPVVKKYIPQ